MFENVVAVVVIVRMREDILIFVYIERKMDALSVEWVKGAVIAPVARKELDFGIFVFRGGALFAFVKVQAGIGGGNCKGREGVSLSFWI